MAVISLSDDNNQLSTLSPMTASTVIDTTPRRPHQPFHIPSSHALTISRLEDLGRHARGFDDLSGDDDEPHSCNTVYRGGDI